MCHLSWDFLQDAPINHHMLHGDGDCSKVKLLCCQSSCLNYFSLREILLHVKLDYKKHCSMPLLSYVLAHNEPTLTNTAHVCALDLRIRVLPYPHLPGHYITLCHCHSHNLVTINDLGKSNGIQSFKITNLCGHLLFDSMDPALLVGVHNDDDDDDTSLAGVSI